MAGDWIKVEVGLSRKAEVLKMARMLGESRRYVTGLLIDFFIWCDANSVDGVVDGVVDADVDAVMECSGLSACMREVGWIEFDESPQRMRMVNWDRHNGETAKKRALKNKRQANWRANVDANVDTRASTKASTREEKRREDTDTSLRSVSVALATPTSDHEALARSLGVSCQTEFQKYRDWLASSGKRQRDESAGFRNWLRKAGEFKARDAPRSGKQDARARTAAQIFGGNDERSSERVINGEAERIA